MGFEINFLGVCTVVFVSWPFRNILYYFMWIFTATNWHFKNSGEYGIHFWGSVGMALIWPNPIMIFLRFRTKALPMDIFLLPFQLTTIGK